MTEKQSAEANGPVEGNESEQPEGEGAAVEEVNPANGGNGSGAADAANGEQGNGEAETLRARLEEAEARAQEYWDRILRMEAEKDNIRKRAEKDAASARRQALEKFATEMLAVRDSLELGYDAANQEDADIGKIREGTELTLKMLTQALEKFDIEEISPHGEKFDPELHQAMSTQPADDEHPANTVVSVVQKGYRLEERLLRPALVIVAK